MLLELVLTASPFCLSKCEYGLLRTVDGDQKAMKRQHDPDNIEADSTQVVEHPTWSHSISGDFDILLKLSNGLSLFLFCSTHVKVDQ